MNGRSVKNLTDLIVRSATDSDRSDLRAALVELQEHERRHSATRMPGEAIADAYLAWMLDRVETASGAVFIAEVDDAFAGFAAGWVENDHYVEETPDSNRYGLLSDLYVLPAFRRLGAAMQLLDALEAHLARAGVTRIRVSALAANSEARATYARASYAPHEVVYEKVVRTMTD